MALLQTAPTPREVRLYFIDDDIDFVREFEHWWRDHRRPGVVATARYASEPPWLDEATQARIVEFKPDLIVLDLLLRQREESGENVLRDLKNSALFKHIPVFIYSAQLPSTSKEWQQAERRYRRLGAERIYDKADKRAFDHFVDFALEQHA
jgi:CheY-like chemotaxis protein